MIKIFVIGIDGTEYFAGESIDEVKDFLVKLMGKKEAESEFSYCAEVPLSEYDKEFDYNDDGTIIKTTWAKIISQCKQFPTQLSSGYL